MKTKTFTDYLEEQFAKTYTGTDDDMPDKFLNWLDGIEQWEMINYGDDYGKELVNSTPQEGEK